MKHYKVSRESITSCPRIGKTERLREEKEDSTDAKQHTHAGTPYREEGAEDEGCERSFTNSR